MRVIAATPKWSLNGVNVFSAHQVRELNLRGHDACCAAADATSELVGDGGDGCGVLQLHLRPNGGFVERAQSMSGA